MKLSLVLSGAALACAEDSYCCWWPQNLSPSECSKCANKDHSARQATCGSPAVWCDGDSPSPATSTTSPSPAPAPLPVPTPSPSRDRAFDDDAPSVAPSLVSDTNPWPEGAGTSVSVTVDPSNGIGTFTKYHMGINIIDSSAASLVREKATDLIKQAGFKFLRFPGGSPADAYIWDGNYEKYPFFKQFKNDYDFGINTDDLIAMCKETGAEPVIQINYAMFVLYGQEAGADLAVRWYQYFKDHGITVKYWELGNENSGAWEVPQSSKDCSGFDGPPETCQSTNGEQYGLDFAFVAAALRNVDPSIKIGAWLETNEREDGAGQRKAKWDSLLMPQLQSDAGSSGAADWLNIHSYFWQPMDWSKGEYVPYQPADLYAHDAGMLAQTKSDLVGILEKYFPDGRSLPVAMTEWNIDQAFPHADPQVDEHLGALVTADIIGQAVTGDVGALNYFALTDGWKTDPCASGPCPGDADLGIMVASQPDAEDGTPRPALFAFSMWSRAMAKRIVESHSSDSDITTYASQFDSGEVGLLIINRKTEDVQVQVQGVASDSHMQGWILTPSDSSSQPLDYSPGSAWNGEGPSGKYGGPSNIDSIKPYAADGQKLLVPKVSLVGVVFHRRVSLSDVTFV